MSDGVVFPQYRNASNPLAHYDSTAEEILQQCEGVYFRPVPLSVLTAPPPAHLGACESLTLSLVNSYSSVKTQLKYPLSVTCSPEHPPREVFSLIVLSRALPLPLL